MTLDEYSEWLSKPHETWEIVNRFKLHQEAVFDCMRAMGSEKWDKDRKKKLAKEFKRLQKEREAFEKLKWQLVPVETPQKPPYSFEPGALYVCQVLDRGRWITKSRGKPTLRRMLNFAKIIEDSHSAFRVRKRLPNGVWFAACMASDHYGFVKMVIKYLEYCKVNNLKPEASKDSFLRE